MSRQPNYEFQEWWNRERERAFLSPSVIDDTTTTSTSSSSSSPPPNSNWANTTPPTTPASASAASNGKGKNRRSARQLSWLICLRLHHSLSILFTLPSRLLSLFSTAIRRISSASSSSSRDSSSSSLLYRIIRAFLVLAIILFIFEVAAYFKGWHLTPPSYASSAHALEILYANWLHIRANYLAPPLQAMANVCILLFLLQSLDRILLMLGCAWIRFKGIKPVAAAAAAAVNYNNNINSSPSSATVVNGDVEQGSACLIHHHYYPMVLLQIPMCNEREVYQQSIAAVCIQDWPRERMLVQVLDDSDDIDVQQLIKAEVQKWQQKGINIVYRHRLIRTGYKAGNLKSAMSCDYVNDYEFVAIFDADFQPGQDFLKRTIPHFKGNDDLALVQTRWAFVNKDENLLTRLQNINLSFHFEVEQQVNGLLLNFFGFNGTAGVWRIKALEESGGWLERTTVEDMDIAVRAHLCGWKFIFLNDVKSLCELPESYAAYKKQQHRWHSGPMQLFRLCFMDILRSKVSVLKKANLIFLFFLLRKLILPFYSFTLFYIIPSLTMFLLEAQLPTWVVCYVPGIMPIINILPAPRSFPFLVLYLLFENTMSVTKFNAMISGLFKLGSSYEWVETKKLGRSSEADLTVFTKKESETQSTNGGSHRATSKSGLACRIN